MLSLFINVTSFFALGAFLALTSIQFNISTGAIGAALLLCYGVFMKWRWNRRPPDLARELCDCEKALWIQVSAYTLLLGHSVTALLHTEIDIRVGQGSTIAIDSWLMIIAAIATEFMFWRHRKITDERDARYSANATAWSYRIFASLIIFFALYLALTPPSFRSYLSNFLIGNILVALTLLAYCAYISIRLLAYYRDRKGLVCEKDLVVEKAIGGEGDRL